MSRLGTAPSGPELQMRRIGAGQAAEGASWARGGGSPARGLPFAGLGGSYKALPEALLSPDGKAAKVYRARIGSPASPSSSERLMSPLTGAGVGDLGAGRLNLQKRLPGLPPLGQQLKDQLQACWSSAPNLLDTNGPKGKIQLRSLAELGARKPVGPSQEREASDQRPRAGGQTRAGQAAMGQEQGRRKGQAPSPSRAGEKVWARGMAPRISICSTTQQPPPPQAPGQKRVIKNPAVWQRYQAQPRSGLQCTEVLERDRERQRSVVAVDMRQAASPTKSRTAAIFFENVPGNDDSIYECLPPGALRHMARPSMRFGVLPDMATGSSVSSTLCCASLGRRDPRVPVNKEFREISEEAVFEGNEESLVELGNVLDAYAALVAPPAAPQGSPSPAAPGGKPNSAKSKSAAAEGEAVLLRETSSMNLSERELPVLRPLFCRFLLASGLCGTDVSEYSYHECVAAFDEQATTPLSGSPSGLYRATLLKVVAGIVWPDRGYEDAEDRSESQQIEIITTMKKKIQVMFTSSLPLAAEHCKARRRRLEERRTGKAPVAEDASTSRSPSRSGLGPPSKSPKSGPEEPGELPGEVPPSAGEASAAPPIPGIVWPPLPPRYVTEKELPAYMEGVKQWEDELNSQNADRLRALRAHTDAVLLGEILVGQLLEPEVLHFTTRFRPLFESLFDDYADWPVLARGPVTPIKDGKRGRCQHMSFAAFFKFCVDFGLFPKHASFEEIQKIYGDAEAMEPAAPPPSSEEQEPQPSSPSGPSTPTCRGSMARRTLGSVKADSSLKDLDAAKRGQVSKRRTTMGVLALTTSLAAAEANLPKVDMKLFERPLLLMTDFEIQTLAFLAGVSDWLGERFTRLADYVSDYVSAIPPEEEPAEANTSHASPERRSTMGGGSVFRRVTGLAGRRSTIGMVEERRASSVGIEEVIATISSVPPSVTVSAQRFYELTLPMGTERGMTEAEVVQMYRLLLNNLEADLDSPPPEIPVFQLDKAVGRAAQRMEQERHESCRLFRRDEDQSHSERICCRFFEAFDNRLRESHRFTGGDPEDIFQGRTTLMPQELLEKASQLGVEEDLHPLPAELGNVFQQVGAKAGAGISRAHFWRLMAVLQERFRLHRQAENRNRMQCLAHTRNSGPGALVFGLGAFVECLLKLALHRLGSKGGSEIQRASPSWWKCVWLLMLLGGRYTEHLQAHRHYTRMRTFALSTSHAPPPVSRSGSRCSTPVGPSMLSVPQRIAGGVQRLPSTSDENDEDEARANSPKESNATDPSNAWPSAPSTPATMPSQLRTLRSSKSAILLNGRPMSSAPSTPRTSSSVTGPASVLHTPPQLLRPVLRRESKRKFESNPDREPQRDQLAQSLDVWWRCVYSRTLPNYVPPLSRLMTEMPCLFDHSNAESRVSGDEYELTGMCHVCLEQRSPSGWGSPGCAACSGVEEYCLPFEDHLFSELLRTPSPPPRPAGEKEAGEENDRKLSRAPSMSDYGEEAH